MLLLMFWCVCVSQLAAVIAHLLCLHDTLLKHNVREHIYLLSFLLLFWVITVLCELKCLFEVALT